MASIDLEQLYTKYEGYYYPQVKVYLGGIDPTEIKKLSLVPVDFSVELTSDYKASIATFSLLGGYEVNIGYFITHDLKPLISLGTDVKILMGHASEVTEVFKGYVAGVDFVYNSDSPSESSIRLACLYI